MKPALLSAAVALALPALAQAADAHLPELVVEASKLEKDPFTMTQSTSVLEEEDIRDGAYSDVTEILRSLPGIEFKQVGGPGQYTYLRMRGFSAGHVLVVLDGVTLNHPSSGDAGSLLGRLDPASISRIEVLRGPQAVLYGANATAGVISITTKRGREPHLSVGAEAGSRAWKKARASWQHVAEVGEGQLRSAVHASKVDSGGLIKHEAFRDETLQLALDYSSARFDAGLSVWHDDSRFNFAHLTEVTRTARPSYWSSQLPDPNAYNDFRTGVFKAYVEHHLSDALSQRLEAGWTESRRKILDRDDGLLGHVTAPWDHFSVDWVNFYQEGERVPVFDRGSAQPANYKDRSAQFDYSLRYAAGGAKALAGIERYESSAKQWGSYGRLDGDADRKSFYLNGEYALGTSGLTLAGGLRHDDYDVWGSKTTGSVGASYALGSLTLFANHGTSYRAPTLGELFNPIYGSTALKPESGRTTEIGIRQLIPDIGLSWEANAWLARLKDAVIYDAGIPNPRNPWGGHGQYANANEQRTRGVELSFAWALDPRWTVTGNYTYTDSHIKDAARGWGRTVLVAPNRASVGVRYSKGALTAGASAYYTDSRLDWTRRDRVDDYLRVDVSARYAATRDLALYARIENLFDADTREGLGYKTPGVYGIAGIEYRFF